MKVHRQAADGRTIFIWKGPEDVARLTEAIAALAIAELFDTDEGLVWCNDGETTPVSKDVLREILMANFAGVRLVRRGAGYEREFYAYAFPPEADLRKEPNERMLIDILNLLPDRVVKGPRTPRLVPEAQHESVRYRLKTGEPAARIARELGTDADTIKALARG